MHVWRKDGRRRVCAFRKSGERLGGERGVGTRENIAVNVTVRDTISYPCYTYPLPPTACKQLCSSLKQEVQCRLMLRMHADRTASRVQTRILTVHLLPGAPLHVQVQWPPLPEDTKHTHHKLLCQQPSQNVLIL